MDRIVRECESVAEEPNQPAPSLWDWLQSIAAQAPGKQPGMDGVVPEMLHFLPLRAKLYLAELLAERYQGGLHLRPEGWRDILLNGIPKEATSRTLDKWRWIALTPVLQKIFLRPVVGLMNEHRLASSVHVYGFRPQCSCVHVSELVRTVMLKAAAYGKKCYVMSADVKHAFQGISHQWAQRAMRHFQVPALIRKNMLEELSDLRCAAVLPGRLPQTFALIPWGKGGRG